MYYDLLTRIKNAGSAKQETTLVPYAKFDFAIAKALVDTGYLEDVQKKTIGRKSFMELRLRYKDREPVFKNFKLVSKPSRRIYSGYRPLKPVRQHYGLSMLSTPSGVMTNKDARKKKIGGEYLFEVW